MDYKPAIIPPKSCTHCDSKHINVQSKNTKSVPGVVDLDAESSGDVCGARGLSASGDRGAETISYRAKNIVCRPTSNHATGVPLTGGRLSHGLSVDETATALILTLND